MDETTNTVYFTHVEYDEEVINSAIDKYNAEVEPDLQIPWNAKTMVEGVLIRGETSLELS